MWLDDAWDVDRATDEVDDAGWQYSTNWSGAWSGRVGAMSLVRQRRWYRHRALATSMDASTAARLGDDAIDRMTAEELRLTIASGGLGHRNCTTHSELRKRAVEARDTARAATSRHTATAAIAEAAAGVSSRSTTAVPLMPPVLGGRSVQLQLPGSQWSAPIHLEAVGTHGLLEIASEIATAGMDGQASRGSYQLALSLTLCPGAFARSKMLTVAPRVMLVNALPCHPIAFKQDALLGTGQVLLTPCPFPRLARHMIATRAPCT